MSGPSSSSTTVKKVLGGFSEVVSMTAFQGVPNRTSARRYEQVAMRNLSFRQSDQFAPAGSSDPSLLQPSSGALSDGDPHTKIRQRERGRRGSSIGTADYREKVLVH